MKEELDHRSIDIQVQNTSKVYLISEEPVLSRTKTSQLYREACKGRQQLKIPEYVTMRC